MPRIENNDKRESFQFFNSWDDFDIWAKEAYEATPDEVKGKQTMINSIPSTDWEGSSSIEELDSEITKFIDPERLDAAIDDVRDLFASIDLGGSFERSRMTATDKPIGVFDFNLASTGLYRPQEYYSPELDKLIDPNLVQKIQKSPPVFVYYEHKKGEDKKPYVLIQQQEGTHCLAQKKKYEENLVHNGAVPSEAKKQAKQKFPNCKLVFRTTNRKVYLVQSNRLLAEEEAGREKYVDLFLPVGGLVDQTPRTLLYAVLPSLLLSYFLNVAGIKTRILSSFSGAVKGTRDPSNRSQKRFMTSYIIKDYDDSFDFNQIAIATADSRVFRWKMFKALVGTYYTQLNKRISGSLGSQDRGAAFQQQFERYKKYYIGLAEEGDNILNKNRNLMFSSKIVPKETDSDEKLLEQAKTEFFKLIDAIDIEFNGAATAIPRIRKRDTKRGVDVSSLRQRLAGTIAMTTNFDESDSKYSNTDAEIQRSIDKKTKLTEDVNTYLQSENK